MFNYIPVVGWMLSLFFNISLAIPFWVAWTLCGIGETYFYWLPKVYQSIGFWSCVGLFMCLSILNVVIPKPISINNSSESKTKG